MIFAVLFSSLPATSAKAADASPSPVPIGQLIIKGTMKNNDKPVEGVKFKITGEGGFNGEATSIADGTWQIEVKTKGIYKVEILVDSLPKGVGLREPDKNVREVNLNITTTAAVLFPLGKDTRVVQPFGEQVLIRLFAGINLGLLLALAAIGISLIFGTTGLSNFAHGEMLTFGALMTWLLHVQLGLNLLLAIVLTVGLSAGFGWLQDAGLWKPLRKRRLGLNQMMIVSIGFSIVLRYVLLIIFGGDTLVLTSDFAPVQLGPDNLYLSRRCK